MSMCKVIDNYRRVKDKINSLCEKFQNDPELLIVSKFQSKEDILILHNQENQIIFGENYVQELLSKSKSLPKTIKWYFIGHLQKNKVKSLLSIDNLVMIETIDSIELAELLNKTCESMNKRILKVMIQVKTSNESTKNGVEIKDVIKVFEYIVLRCQYLKFQGLMTMGNSNIEFTDECFEKMKKLREDINELIEKNYNHLDIECKLSMGTTRDLEMAIKYGSNEVRIGSAIFGERNKFKHQL